jgi:hypothetical protein
MSSLLDTVPTSALACAMFFGSVVFATTAISASALLSGDLHIFMAIRNPNPSALDFHSLDSIYTLLFHLSIFGFILLYSYICEHNPPYPHAEKTNDQDSFYFFSALLFVVALFTLEQNQTTSNKKSKRSHKSDTEILNRPITDEWKGWMQCICLLSNYWQDEVGTAVQWMTTCYVWMTGFGNFSFFDFKRDYSIVRVLQMLWRLNFLAIFLCLTQGTTYILYDMCLLHTYFFLAVYGTMRIAKETNDTNFGVRVKLAVLAVIIYVIWDLDLGIFRILHAPFLEEKQVLGAKSGAMWEWYFQSSQHHWSTFLGMLFALNSTISNIFIHTLESQPLVFHVTAKLAMGMVLLIASYLCVIVSPRLLKNENNQTNAYFGFVPLLTYIYFRNLTTWLRDHTLRLFHQFGKITLETYLMQHHIWLASNKEGLVQLLPGWTKMNFLVASLLFLFLSRHLHFLTISLRGMILPDDRTSCLQNFLAFTASIAFFLVVATILRSSAALNFLSISLVSCFFGSLIYYIIPIRPNDSATTINEITTKNPAKRLVLLVAGACGMTIAGLCWRRMAGVGANTVTLLPERCSHTVLQGRWIPVNGCSESMRGSSYRNYGIESFGTCDATVWGWSHNETSIHCRFRHRSPANLLNSLRHRNITFVGDSMVRHLYHATCRQLGDNSAGAYNTSMGKWSDFSRLYDNTSMDFWWAPFVSNLSTVVQGIMQSAQQIDLVVIGGGAWDRLHTYNTMNEQETLHDNVLSLGRKLEVLKTSIPIVWVVPTVINSWALMTDQKRENIREEQMERLRILYHDLGIHDSVSFVLDGTSFTKDRVSESYDGVHYPLSVYDGGAQILANALDWLLTERVEGDSFVPPVPGSLAHPFLGLLVLLFTVFALFTFDGFMGFSYSAALLVKKAAPIAIYEDSFRFQHQSSGLHDIQEDFNGTLLQNISGERSGKRRYSDASSKKEVDSLLT